MDSRSHSTDGPVPSPWAIAANEVAGRLGVVVSEGLGDQEVRNRLSGYGPNRLFTAPRASLWQLLLGQFQNVIVALLAAAAGVAFALGDWLEGIAVVAVLLVNAGIGFVIEWRAVRSMEALRKLVVPQVRVRREGRLIEIPAQDLVPGDVVAVEAGDIIAADLRIVECAELQADESTLTGESEPVAKREAVLPKETDMADRNNLLHSGSRITRGTGIGIVVATGLASELGKISALVAQAEADEAAESTPLEARLAHLGVRLLWLTLAVAVATFVAGWATGKDLALMLKTAIALAVAAIPEGLPVVATIALARGLWRMAERNALINRLSAVETLGATGVICTDKTGTLTENRMTVVRLVLPDSGELEFDRQRADELPQDAILLLEIGAFCNNAEEPGGVGDPLETALLAAAEEAGIDWERNREKFPRVREFPFESERRLMATCQRRAGTGTVEVSVKGGPEAVLAACRMTSEERQRWLNENERLAGAGLRILAMARKQVDSETADPYENLQFAGLIGLQDPPRADVPEAIAECRAAGIRVVMVTGDQPRTALAIAREVGLLDENEVGARAAEVIPGHLFETLDPGKPADRERLLSGRVFARVTPEQKLQLVRLHQESGQVVAMTGDGVNDAPALTQADIGIAMGKRGTEVAREAGDMVLRDDAFPSIVVAVAQGRVIFENLRKFVTYLLACNLSEILVVGLATLFSQSLPILPLQILFLNLVTDVFPALALGVGKAGGNLMARPPRASGEPVMRNVDWRRVFQDGLVLAAATLGAYFWAVERLGMTGEEAVTVSFLTLALTQLTQVFNLADADSPLFRSEVVRNPAVWVAIGVCVVLLWMATAITPLAEVLGLHAPTSREWGSIFLFGMIPLAWGLVQRAVGSLPGE